MGRGESRVGKENGNSQCLTRTFSILCIVTKVHLGPALRGRYHPAEHSPDLQARLSLRECLHPHWSVLKALCSRAYQEGSIHATKCPIKMSAKPTHSVSSTLQSAPGQLPVPSPLSSQALKMADSPWPQLLLVHRDKVFSQRSRHLGELTITL